MKEKTLVTCRRHWIRFIIPIFLAVLIFWGGSELSKQGQDPAGSYILAVLIALPFIISYFTDYISVTESKVVAHKGFIRSSRVSAPISKIQNVEISNGLLGKLLRYHTVVIDNAGTAGKEFVFRYATNAVKLERVITDLQR